MSRSKILLTGIILGLLVVNPKLRKNSLKDIIKYLEQTGHGKDVSSKSKNTKYYLKDYVSRLLHTKTGKHIDKAAGLSIENAAHELSTTSMTCCH